jgi:hypothetical protein
MEKFKLGVPLLKKRKVKTIRATEEHGVLKIFICFIKVIHKISLIKQIVLAKLLASATLG